MKNRTQYCIKAVCHKTNSYWLKITIVVIEFLSSYIYFCYSIVLLRNTRLLKIWRHYPICKWGTAEACFSCKMTDRILPTSFDGVLPVLGLKSHNFATRSHSVPGDISWVVDRNSCSALSDAERLAACSFVSCKQGHNQKVAKKHFFVINHIYS